MTGRRRADVLALIVLGGFVLAVGAHYVLGYYEQRPYPHSTFLFSPSDKFVPAAQGIGVHFFGDFFGTWKHSRDGSPYLAPSIFYVSNYLPFTHLLLKPLTVLSYPLATATFLLGTSIATAAVFWRRIEADDRVARALLTVVLAGLTYPILFALDRGNVDILIFLLLWSSLLAVLRERWLLAAALIGAAAAMKGVPALMAVVLVAHRQWRALVVSAATGLGLTLGGLLVMDGGVVANAEGLWRALTSFNQAATQGTMGLQHTSTVTSALGVIDHYLPGAGVTALATPLSLAVLVAAVAAVVLLPLALWEQVSVLAIAMIVVPPVSYDYRLTLLLLPVLLVLAPRDAPRVGMLPLVLLGVLLVPKGLPVLWADVGLGSIANPVLMLVLLAVLVVSGTRRRIAEVPVAGHARP